MSALHPQISKAEQDIESAEHALDSALKSLRAKFGFNHEIGIIALDLLKRRKAQNLKLIANDMQVGIYVQMDEIPNPIRYELGAEFRAYMVVAGFKRAHKVFSR